MTDRINVEAFRIAFVHRNVKCVTVFVFANILILFLCNKFLLCSVEIMLDSTSEDDYESSSQPQKKQQKIYCDCIIHCSDSTNKLVSPESLESWNVVLRAAEIRNHKAVLDVAKEIDSSSDPDLN